MSEEYSLVERLPTPEEYRAICAAVGWESAINFEAAATSLRNSLYGVVAIHAGEVVGMGRIVGDGAIYFYIQDIAVLPEHQQRGVGQMIVGRLIDYLEAHAPDKSFVGLFAAEGAQLFYEQFGFVCHPALTGMFLVIRQPYTSG